MQTSQFENRTRESLQQLIASVGSLDAHAMQQARQRQAILAKPPGSLGKLEDLSVQLAGITGKVCNTLERKVLLVFCADNGVVTEGVSSCPQSVTAAQTINLARGKTGAAVLAKHFDCTLQVYDVGVAVPIEQPGVRSCKVACGTKNIACEPAMTEAQALQAVFSGAQAVSEAVQSGAQVIGIGEMGIGNTTTSAAVLCALTGKAVKAVAGKGAGLTPQAYENKCAVIERALQKNHTDTNDTLGILAALGGFDIAAMTGACIAAAAQRVPVVIDGFISAVAALCAYRLCPLAREYMIASHDSLEIGYRVAVNELKLQPLLQLDMRLGEGSGCPPAMMLLQAACALINDMASFEEAAIDDSYLEVLRGTDAFTLPETGVKR
ncbi:MAG: nicotinate-nucleotide--dimethylbenzimidazole phosphoribosyltransferase [Clostridia bacterium]|nr:nicotinate-nucleotide--dimethylbenzimidazole phosphoribosyltransferase [Clostridia bacterium]